MKKHVIEKETQEVDRTSIEVLEKYLEVVVEENDYKTDSLKRSASNLVREKMCNKEEIAIRQNTQKRLRKDVKFLKNKVIEKEVQAEDHKEVVEKYNMLENINKEIEVEAQSFFKENAKITKEYDKYAEMNTELERSQEKNKEVMKEKDKLVKINEKLEKEASKRKKDRRRWVT